MIKVSESASKKIIDMMKEEGFDAATDYVRVGVKSGGCSGLSYELKFDKELGENDKVFEDSNVKIAVEKKSLWKIGSQDWGKITSMVQIN